MTRPCRVATLALVFVAVATSAQATDYWVSPSGNDAASGLSPAAAWATLVHAAGGVGAGDTVHVQPGNYQGFYLDASGAPGSPIAFVATGPGVAITADNPVTPDGINIEGADHVVIDGFTITGRTRAGIRAALSDFVTIRNCTAGDNGRWGIFTGFTDDLLVENNETYGSVLEHGIYISNSCDRPVARGNHVHDNFANGIHLNGDESQGGDGWIEDALIEGNVIHGNGAGGGSGINGDGLINSVIRNNLLYDNHASGISLYRIDGATGATGNVVVNNTILNAANARWCINIDNGSTGNTLRNNILYNEHSFRGVITIDPSSLQGFSSDYNSVMSRFSSDGGNTVIGFAAWQALGYDANSFLATPAQLFLSPGIDFHLAATSAAIDAGTATHAPSVDLDGAPRPVGGGYDVGAYEAQLLECGDGNVDAGEECGEPGLSCSAPCTQCSGCICASAAPVCGDALVCGAEQCESDGDCAAGQSCQGCVCVNEATCGSGILLAKPSLKLSANPLRMKARGDLVVPLPWIAVDPSGNGV
ncbi:MAG TPA: right-handed parallel beta-helix repeat-containing protein, partial [Candidatus Binatia bacterium]|nr:right-handed parallel beta-helix repeat-containing protein [Candidatus Binatia bacterium]